MTAAEAGAGGFDAIVRLVGARTGLTFPEHRLAGVQTIVRRAMERARVPDLDRYRRAVESDRTLFDDLVSELTIGETYFFRDPAQYELIRDRIVPEIHLRRGEEHTIRVWSAACSSGEEPYSLAMLFDERGLGDRVHLLATDISRVALARAHAARYRPWSLRNEASRRARPYLEAQGDTFVLTERIRRRVAFAWLNLALDGYPSAPAGFWGMDVILCRNVLIYFDGRTIADVARRLYETLADGGWLLTAASDPPLGEHAPFHVEVGDAGVVYRRMPPAVAAEVAAPAIPSRPPPARRTLPAPSARSAAPAAAAPKPDAGAATHRLRELGNADPAGALGAVIEALAAHPLSTDLHYLHALVLLQLGRYEDAERALRRVLYLDRSLAVAHFTLGSLLERSGNREGARRAYRNARELCVPRPSDEPLPLADGECAGSLVEATDAHLALLGAEAV